MIRYNPSIHGEHFMDALPLFLQQKEFIVKTCLILFRIACIDPAHYQRAVSVLLSTPNPPSSWNSNNNNDINNNNDSNDNDNDNDRLQHLQKELTTLQRLAIFAVTVHPVSNAEGYSLVQLPYKREILDGIQLSDDEYFQLCKERIEQLKDSSSFGILRIINMANSSTVTLLILFLQLADPYKQTDLSEPMKYILHIHSERWRGIERERMRELLDIARYEEGV